jgi:hypothetical protein
VSFPIGIIARAAEMAHMARFGYAKPTTSCGSMRSGPFVFRCASHGCARSTEELHAQTEEDAMRMAVSHGWRYLFCWSCPECAERVAIRDLQEHAAEAHRAVERARLDPDPWVVQRSQQRNVEVRMAAFLAAWSLRFGEHEPECWG